jgi:hypothetical protein
MKNSFFEGVKILKGWCEHFFSLRWLSVSREKKKKKTQKKKKNRKKNHKIPRLIKLKDRAHGTSTGGGGASVDPAAAAACCISAAVASSAALIALLVSKTSANISSESGVFGNKRKLCGG